MTHDALVAAARGVFEATGAESVDPAYILPSDIPLELSGEAVRARAGRAFGLLAAARESWGSAPRRRFIHLGNGSPRAGGGAQRQRVSQPVVRLPPEGEWRPGGA